MGKLKLKYKLMNTTTQQRKPDVVKVKSGVEILVFAKAIRPSSKIAGFTMLNFI